MKTNKFIVVGAGAWGTALAIQIASNTKEKIYIWAFEKETVDEINSCHKNSVFLPDVNLPSNLIATNEINDLEHFDYILNVIPTQFIRSSYKNLSFSFDNKIIINASKGIEQKTLKRISEIFQEVLGISEENYAVLTGPSHAEEVSRNIPTTIVAASKNIKMAQKIQQNLSTNSLRIYSTNDVIGCELGGALKNIIALTAGMLDGLQLGDNTKAALITRGLAEISRLGVALGASPLTFAGLSGLGDLVVTCSSKHSRNRKVGELIGQGLTLENIISSQKTVAEGVYTTASTYELANKIGVEMPITEQTYKALFENIPAKTIVDNLMTRDFKHEIWS